MTQQYSGQTLGSYFENTPSIAGQQPDVVLQAMQGFGQQVAAVAAAVSALQSEVLSLRQGGIPVPADLQDRLDTLTDHFETLQQRDEEEQLAKMTADEVIAYYRQKEQQDRERAGGRQQGQGQELRDGVHTDGPLKQQAEDEYVRFVLPQLVAAAAEQGYQLSEEQRAFLDRQNVEADANGRLLWTPWMEQHAKPWIKQWGQAFRQQYEPSPARQAGGSLGDGMRPGAPGGMGRPDFFKASQDELIQYAQAGGRR